MALGLHQNLILTQQLVMTPQLQQAIKLLQLSRLELAGMIEQELEENPALEESVQEITQAEAREIEQETETKDEGLKEVTIEENLSQETDWESYINEYNSTGRVHTS